MVPNKLTRPTFKSAIEWIAFNDEPGETDAKTTSELISVAIIADIFGTTVERVAADVLKVRAAA